MNTTEGTSATAVGGSALSERLGPFAELHEPESEFEDGTWHKPLPQGWSGGTLVYTEAQMQARVAAERERWQSMLLSAVAEAELNARQHREFVVKVDESGWWCESKA